MENNINIQIKALIEKTIEGKVNWLAVGQNNFRWTKQKNSTLFTTTLNKQILPLNPNAINQFTRELYQFVIQTTNPNEIILQINTSNDPETLESIRQLYEVVNNFSRKNSANIIQKLIEDL